MNYLALTVSLGCILKVHGNTFIVFLLFPTPDFGFLIEQHVKTRNYPSGSIKKTPKNRKHLTIIKNHRPFSQSIKSTKNNTKLIGFDPLNPFIDREDNSIQDNTV